MAKTSAVVKNERRKRQVALKWEKRQALKKIVSSPTSTEEERAKAAAELDKLPRNSSPVRVRHRCMMTGRPRGYLRKFQMSRICFRELASMGLVPGVIKASW